MKHDQTAMFTTADLPLFSGTAPRVREQAPVPETDARQPSLPARCRLCQDTGNVGGKPCICDTGARYARDRAARLRRQAAE